MGLISKLRAGTALVSAFMGVAIAAPAFAQDGAGQGSEIDLASAFELPPIITSASRLSAGLSSSSVTVVEREAIDRHPGLTIPEILATEAGLHIRDLFGNGNESATVDIRGFGEQAGQNVLVLVDGRKINDLDLSGVQFSLVPRASIQRIEVLRGSAASVLYGEGGVGGAINIVTQGGDKEEGVTLSATGGSFGFRRTQGLFQWGGKPAHVALSADVTESDGYRHNNELTRQVYSAVVSIDRGATDYRLSATYNTEETGLPGNRLVDTSTGLDLVRTNPRGAQTPEDGAEERGVRLEAGVESQLSDSLKLSVDAGYRRSVTSSDFQFQLDDRSVSTATLTPRVTYSGTLGGMAFNAITGVDLSYSQGEVEQRFVGFPGGNDFDGWQSSMAIYGQGDLGLTDRLTLDAGVRVIRTEIKLDSPQNTAARVRDTETNWAGNLGLAYDVTDDVEVFVRGGHAVRVPTIDERVGTRLDPITFQPISFDLDTQTSWDLEVGTEFSVGPVDARVSAFQINVKDQIAFTPDTIGTFGFNTNLDDTRRRGVEAEARAPLGWGFELAPRVTYTEAEFTKGPFDGNEVPVVPEWTGGVGLNWTGDDVWASLNWRYVSDQRMINDQEGIFPEIPSYDLLDVALGWSIGNVALKGEIRNALDEDYFTSAAASDTNANRYGAFPLPGRAAYVEASVAF
ncbi:TonB-dependent receptor [Pyruvatibacter mobilis]|uniref:TonB-dependent receptor n=1 Tax=Pyruvatibacter mobilis TaxID=1712261 RepID=UPI003BAA5479